MSFEGCGREAGVLPSVASGMQNPSNSEQGFPLLLRACQQAPTATLGQASFQTQAAGLVDLGLAPVSISQPSVVSAMQGFDAAALQSMMIANGQPAAPMGQAVNNSSPQALMNALNLLQQVRLL